MINSARKYHRRTSYDPSDMGGGWLDWGTQPRVFKTYEGLSAVSLPEVHEWPENRLTDLLAEGPARAGVSLDTHRLSQIVRLAHAVTAKTRYAGADFFYRSVASAGALYPFELYVAVIKVNGLPSGLYHHNVLQQELTLLRSGSAATHVAQAVGLDQATKLQAAFFLTSIFFRSSWKYRDRAYRYHLLDTGHLAENLFLAIKAQGLPCEFHYDFDDNAANALLCLDQDREACLAVALVGGVRQAEAVESEPLQDSYVDLKSRSWMAAREVNYKLIEAVHALSTRVADPHMDQAVMEDRLGVTITDTMPLTPPTESPEVMGYAEAVFKRRSMRNFVDARLSRRHCSTLLGTLSSGGGYAAGTDAARSEAIAVGLLVGNVDELPSGFFLLDRRKASLGIVRKGSLLNEMAQVCLGQRWLAKSALHVLFLTNLELLERLRGPRGYRHAMLAAGRLGQRLYLAATSMRLGCCGIGAFYDGEAAQLLGLNDETALLYLVAMGQVRKWSQHHS